MDEPRRDVRNGRVTLANPCPKCGSIEGAFVYEFINGLMVTDTWVCVKCGECVYFWEWNTTQIACQEVRAQAEADRLARMAEKGQTEGAAVLARAEENAKVAAATGGFPEPKPKKEKKAKTKDPKKGQASFW
jgi:hypothetical protein